MGLARGRAHSQCSLKASLLWVVHFTSRRAGKGKNKCPPVETSLLTVRNQRPIDENLFRGHAGTTRGRSHRSSHLAVPEDQATELCLTVVSPEAPVPEAPALKLPKEGARRGKLILLPHILYPRRAPNHNQQVNFVRNPAHSSYCEKASVIKTITVI